MTFPRQRQARERSRAALLTVLLHGLVFVTLLHRTREDPTHGDIARVATRTISMTLDAVAAEPPPPLPIDSVLMAIDDVATMEALRAITIPPADLPATMDAAAPDPDQAGNTMPAEIRYMGEVTARIQRAWAAPVAAREQHCLVRIELGSAGEVRALTVQACDAEPSLQASIMDAIRRAAPLPPRVQGETSPGDLTLDFAAFAVASGGRSSSVQPAAAL